MDAKRAEVLAPAGDKTAFEAALAAGADAVYLGLQDFSARKSAANFTVDDLAEAARKAHALGAKVYVALNTLVKEGERENFFVSALQAWNAGADALIVQELFLGRELKRLYPEMELHLSTQAGVCNAEGARLAKEYGFSRIILARETPLSDIARIAAIVETECFVQGALCTCFSGQCYFSSVVGGNSGNRGLCKQPCRKRYSTAVNNSLFGQNDNLVGGTWAYRAEAYNLSSEALTLMKWKAYKKTDGVNSNSGYYYVMVPLFTTDEAVCDRIEALAMQGRYTEACRDIELFLTNKIRDYDAAKQPVTPEMVEAYYKDKAPLHPWYESRMDARQMAFVQCAADFRRRELLMQGGRWFDIKRFDIEVTHEAYQTGAADVLVRRDLRRAVQIPQEVISYGIAPNPR